MVLGIEHGVWQGLAGEANIELSLVFLEAQQLDVRPRSWFGKFDEMPIDRPIFSIRPPAWRADSFIFLCFMDLRKRWTQRLSGVQDE